MKIIRPGKLPVTVVLLGACNLCGVEFECSQAEAINTPFRNEDNWSIACPTQGCNQMVSLQFKSEAQKEEPPRRRGKSADFEIGDKAVALVDLSRESGKFVPKGTILRIVAIAPKVVIKSTLVRTQPQRYDTDQYFYNAVPMGEPDTDRIREDFVTIKKVHEPE